MSTTSTLASPAGADTAPANSAHAEVANLLREAGLRVTAQRTATLDAVARHPHATQDDVATAVRNAIGSVSTQAVYDVLHTLTAKGLLRRIEPAGSAARYERRLGDNHHHLICRACSKIVDINCATGAAPCLTAEAEHGFVIDEAEVIYWGHCPECQAKNPGQTTRSATA